MNIKREPGLRSGCGYSDKFCLNLDGQDLQDGQDEIKKNILLIIVFWISEIGRPCARAETSFALAARRIVFNLHIFCIKSLPFSVV